MCLVLPGASAPQSKQLSYSISTGHRYHTCSQSFSVRKGWCPGSSVLRYLNSLSESHFLSFSRIRCLQVWAPICWSQSLKLAATADSRLLLTTGSISYWHCHRFSASNSCTHVTVWLCFDRPDTMDEDKVLLSLAVDGTAHLWSLAREHMGE